MTIQNDFLTFAGGSGANVLTQAQYAALASLLANGFQAGVANSAQLNKVWRQSSIMSAVLAAFIVDQSGQPAVDDGTTATLEANLLAGIRNAAKTQIILTDTGTANTYSAANTPALTALATGIVQRVSIGHANTGASTFAPDVLAAKPIYGLALQPLQGNELVANGVAVLMYLVAASVNSGNGAWILIECTGGALQVPNATNSQHAVNAGQIQTQSVTAFTTAGAAPAFTLTPVPAITAYAAGQRFNVTFAAAGTTGSNTINVNGLGTIPLKQYAADGSLVSGIVTTGMNSDVQIVGAGSYALLLDPLPASPSSTPGVFSISTGTVSSNALTIGYPAQNIAFRSATLTSGTGSVVAAAAGSLTIPSGATLGTVSGQQSTVVLLALNNGGTVEPAVVNLAGGVDLSETGLISTTAISSSATSANVVYSANARANVPYKVMGAYYVTEATAGAWATAPSLAVGAGGEAFTALMSFGVGQALSNPTRTAGTTYYNTTARTRWVSIYSGSGSGVTQLNVTLNGSSNFMGNYAPAGGIAGVCFPVPPGWSYSVSGINSTITWTEIG